MTVVNKIKKYIPILAVSQSSSLTVAQSNKKGRTWSVHLHLHIMR